jgi:lipopolysaccharide/colanic/teichoic acid biosynthesis glycosyltransferase
MVPDAPSKGTAVTQYDDDRITRAGKVLRKYCLDEFPQLLNILKGEMSFVGARPEVPKYVQHYTNEMKISLLLPAGITSPASILYKEESNLLKDSTDVDEVYIHKIMPDKMVYNIQYIKSFSFWGDIKIMFQTVAAVIKQK